MTSPTTPSSKKKSSRKTSKHKAETITALSVILGGLASKFENEDYKNYSLILVPFLGNLIYYLGTLLKHGGRVFLSFCNAEIYDWRIKRYIKELEAKKQTPGISASDIKKLNASIDEYETAMRKRRLEILRIDIEN